VSDRAGRQFVRRSIGKVFLALFFAMTPSTVPDWRADPSLRTVAVLPIGEPMRRIG
jgi:hypothetical protein